jgi:hypothetical protein
LVSTGQQQLAAIARAMACDPPLLIADEPTGNLDTRSADTIIGLFQHFVSQGKTIVMVTHDPSLTSRTDRNIILSDGELIDETISRSLPQLRHRHMLEFTKIAERRIFQPRETIISRDTSVDYFFMIRSGEVEAVLKKPRSKETILAKLGKDQFFGDVEFLRGGKAIANVRAGRKARGNADDSPRRLCPCDGAISHHGGGGWQDCPKTPGRTSCGGSAQEQTKRPQSSGFLIMAHDPRKLPQVLFIDRQRRIPFARAAFACR